MECFKPWLKSTADDKTAFCRACLSTISIKSRGIAAVKQHSNTPSHKKRLDVFVKQVGSGSRLSQSFVVSAPREMPTQDPDPVPSPVPKITTEPLELVVNCDAVTTESESSSASCLASPSAESDVLLPLHSPANSSVSNFSSESKFSEVDPLI